MNTKLLKSFKRVEVEKTFNQMAPLKSLRPNGFGAIFYQKHWKMVGTKVSEAILSILNGEGLTPSLNFTFIALIPIKCNAEFISNFRPISLFNVLYKLVSKVITNRLKPIMHAIISSNQSTFILGRLIMDNTMVAHELLLHTLKRKKKGKVRQMIVKLNMSKAYDRIE